MVSSVQYYGRVCGYHQVVGVVRGCGYHQVVGVVHEYKVGVMTYDLWASYRGSAWGTGGREGGEKEGGRENLSDICLTSFVG